MTDKHLIDAYAQSAIKELEKLIKHNKNQDGQDVLWAQMNYLHKRIDYVVSRLELFLVQPGKNKSYMDETRWAAGFLKTTQREVDNWIEHGTQYYLPEGICPNAGCLHYPNDKKHREDCSGRPGMYGSVPNDK
jgi:hypothetical protein